MTNDGRLERDNLVTIDNGDHSGTLASDGPNSRTIAAARGSGCRHIICIYVFAFVVRVAKPDEIVARRELRYST